MYGMPGYETHRNAGVAVAVLALAVSAFALRELLQMPVGDIIVFAPGLVFGVLVGASLPDIDHPDSIPRRILGTVGMVSTPFVAIGVLLVENPIRDTVVVSAGEVVTDAVPVLPQIVAEAAVTLLLVVVLVVAVLKSLDELSKHRGMLHSHLLGIVMGIAVIYLASNFLSDFVPLLFGYGLGAGLTVGVSTHLALDWLH